jgi:DNA-binding Lrp family transcriptional regulator
MALGVGYELQGFAIAIYRTNDELRQAVDYLQSSNYVKSAQAHPVALPPVPIDLSLSKGLDAMKRIDWKILRSLQWDARKTLGDIASDVGASVPTVRKRLAFMRKHNLIEETIQINPAAAERQLVVMLMMRNSLIAKLDPFEFENRLRTFFSESYWISFRMANQPEYMLTFVIDSSKQVAPIRSELVSLFEGTEITHQMIVPQWLYYPDFRDNLIDEHLG